MTDYLNPNRIYPDDISRRIDTPPGFDSVRQDSANLSEKLPQNSPKCGAGYRQQLDESSTVCRKNCTENGTGCPACDWIDTSRQHEDEDGIINYCKVCGRYLRNPGEAGTKIDQDLY